MLTCCKVGKSQPKIIIWTDLVGPQSLMLYTKYEGNRPAGFGEEEFYKVFTIYGHGGHLGHMRPRPFEEIFILSTHKSSTWNLALMGLAASQQKMFESLSDLWQR